MGRILILDDDPGIRRTLEIMLQGDGHETFSAASAEEALVLLRTIAIDIALVDLQLPGMDGISFTKKIRDEYRNVEVIIITAHGSIQTAVEAMKEGSFDYLTKPFSPEQVRHRLGQIEQCRGLKKEVACLKNKLSDSTEREFITQNTRMKHILELARTVAATEATVLITGETGTGKGVMARLIHEWSSRAKQPFLIVDCAGLQENLLESDLFGHKRGAFTGASADKRGKVELASAGTLFLDEIGELPLPLQAKLLRLVEDRVYEQLGDPRSRILDARILAATNRDLSDMVRESTFRCDLFYRLSVVELALPPLRHRVEDIPLLSSYFVAEVSGRYGRPIDKLENEVERLLISYSWPGNTRELFNVIERAVLLAPGRVIRSEHLPERISNPSKLLAGNKVIMSLAELEEAHIREVLSLGLSQEEAAECLGIDPSTLWRKRKKYCV